MYNYRNIDPARCEFVSIGANEDILDGEKIFVEIDNLLIVVFRIGGQLFAIADICSHDEGPLGDGDLEGYEIVCPRHGARFDIRTGKALALPAIIDISAYPVRVIDGQIEIGLPFVE
jgi:3-phenylpropionate/trans-cinnamate dioxygenase ferredoxin subunit